MTHYVERYKKRRMDGFDPLESFAIVAAGIAGGGTIQDLQEVFVLYQEDDFREGNNRIEDLQKDINFYLESLGKNNRRNENGSTTTTVSKSAI